MLKYYLFSFWGLLLLSAPIKLSAQTIHIQEDFNAGSLPTGWSNSALSGGDRWLFGNDGSSNEAGNNNLDSTNMVYFDDDDLGQNASHSTVQLSTPIFNNASETATYLSFDYNFKEYSSVNDSFYVEVFDGTNWNTVFSVDVDDCGTYQNSSGNGPCRAANYPTAFINISAFKSSTCIVRFIYHDGDNWAWYAAIDNVIIYSPEPNDIGVASINFPTSNRCELSQDEFISCQVVNYSADTIQQFKLVAQTDNGAQEVIDTISTGILPQDTLTYTFTKPIDFSTNKDYQVIVFTDYTTDQKAINDSSFTILRSRTIKSLPYSDGFELNNTDWEVSGENPSWQRGTPITSFINSAASGNNAFVTNLSGDYNANEFSYLTSPCFTLDSTAKKLLISCDLAINTEANYDQLYLEYSLDGELSWNKVTKSKFPFNWYFNSTSKFWAGKFNDWKTYKTLLDIPNNTNTVKFRFVFKTDNYNHFEGVGLDNFNVSVIDDKQLEINSVIAPLELPTYECGLSDDEKVKVSLLNIGSSTVDSLKLSYQIESRPKVEQRFYGSFKADSIKSFEFTEGANLFTRKTYRLKVFLEYEKGGSTGYDTITRFIDNEYYAQKTGSYFENFDGMKPISDYTAFPQMTPVDSLSTEWSRYPELNNTNRHVWFVSKDSSYNSFGGPLSDHTSGNGNYLLWSRIRSNHHNTTHVSSPCILLNSPKPELDFWYHRTSVRISDSLMIDVFDGEDWNLAVDTIIHSGQVNRADPYKLKNIDLSLYKFKKVKIRFRHPTLGYHSDFVAIDDFHVYDSSAINERFLQTPIEGTYGKDYALVNYVDWIGTGYQDAYCGTKSYDGHEGTDFTLRSFRQMDSGVFVLAADTGIVTFVQDSLFDREKVSDPAKGLGNYIAIKHPNGYYTYYGHLKKYSLLVNVGDTVSASQRIAEVGSSGNSTDPHLHFELWYDSLYVVDPFSGDCGNDSTLWINPLAYDTNLTVWESGLYLKNVDINNLRERDTSSICCPYEFTNQGDTLSYWAHLLGLRTGDTLTIDWLDSAGTNQLSYDFVMQKDWWYYYFWSYINTQNISVGDWQVLLSRNNQVIDSLNFKVKINPVTQLYEITQKEANCKPITSFSQEELVELDRKNQLEVYNLKGQKIHYPSSFLTKRLNPSSTSIYIVRIHKPEQKCVYKVVK